MSDELIGETFGPYVLQEFVRRGGMAAIYRGYHAALERAVAVKVMSGDLLRDPSFLTRFTNEARLLARLSHPHILPVFDFGEAHGMPYIVMPLMTSSLDDRLEPGQPLPVEPALPLLMALAAALDYAHTQGVLHRDVKPNNVLFDAHGHPYLADFGIAKSLQATAGLTGTGIVGTLEYMSPEQARGDTLDGRSDVYSLAMVAYQALTGELAFSATTPAGYIFKHIAEPPKPPRDANPQLPAEMEAVLLKGLAKEPGRRYQTAQEFTRALAEAQAVAIARTPTAAHREKAGASPTAPSPGSREPIASVTRRSVPVWGWGAALAGLIGVVSLGWALTRTPPAILDVATATGEPLPASATLAASATLPPTPESPTATAPPTPLATATPALRLAFLETFTANNNHWPVGEYSNDREAGRRTLGDRVYRWHLEAKDDVFSWVFGNLQTFSDLRASVVVTQTGGAATSRYGLVLRSADQSRLDALLINQLGEYTLVRLKAGRFESLIGWTFSPALRTDGANELVIETSGPAITLFANGQALGAFADEAARPESAVGLVVDVDKGLELTVEFGALEVRAP